MGGLLLILILWTLFATYCFPSFLQVNNQVHCCIIVEKANNDLEATCSPIFYLPARKGLHLNEKIPKSSRYSFLWNNQFLVIASLIDRACPLHYGGPPRLGCPIARP